MIASALSVLGMLVSYYLVLIHEDPSVALCAGFGDCEAVNSSPYSELFGIPVAVFGFLFYALIFLVQTGRLLGWLPERPVRPFLLLWTTIGLLFSAYLTAIELFVLHAICPWCVVSAVLVTLLFLWSLWDWRRSRVPAT